MQNQPKKHHYVPKFYLQNFTLKGGEDDALFVMDKRQRRRWVSSPKKTGAAKNFYAIDVEGLDPMGIEKAFSKVEGASATVIKDIVQRGAMPTGDGRQVIFEFVALATARVPSIRETNSDFGLPLKLVPLVMRVRVGELRCPAGAEAEA